MANFANLNENNEVINVIVISNDIIGEPNFIFPKTEILGQHFILNVLKLSGNWRQTSYNNTFRKNYAGIGYTYDEERDAFIPPKSYPSWILNEDTCLWDSPTPHPNDGYNYIWNEDTLSWVIFEVQTIYILK